MEDDRNEIVFVFSYCAIANNSTEIFNTVVTDSISTKSDFSETLDENMIVQDRRNLERVSLAHPAITKSFTQISETFVSDLICSKVENGETLN